MSRSEDLNPNVAVCLTIWRYVNETELERDEAGTHDGQKKKKKPAKAAWSVALWGVKSAKLCEASRAICLVSPWVIAEILHVSPETLHQWIKLR